MSRLKNSCVECRERDVDSSTVRPWNRPTAALLVHGDVLQSPAGSRSAGRFTARALDVELLIHRAVSLLMHRE